MAHLVKHRLIHGHSPEDQAILEAAFERNPKPDKATRMALVDRVALGEKEVQVHVPLLNITNSKSEIRH